MKYDGKNPLNKEHALCICITGLVRGRVLVGGGVNERVKRMNMVNVLYILV
jgi:hypothetical protein